MAVALRRRLCRDDAGGDARRDDADRRHDASPFTPPATSSARPRSRSRRTGSASSPRATTSAAPTRPASPSCRSPAISSSPRRPSRCRSSAIRRRRRRSASSSPRSRSFPSAPISSAPIRSARPSGSSGCSAMPATTGTIYLHGAMEKLCRLYEEEGVALGPLAPATVAAGAKGDFAGAVVLCPPSEIAERWARRFPDPVPAFASGWMRIRQRAEAGRRRAAAHPLRSRRLGRTDRDHRRDRAGRGLGHPWPRGGAGPLVRARRRHGPPAAHGRLRGRGGVGAEARS